MHIVPFTLKRSHFASQRLLSEFAAREQLTPARFDLLFLLHRSRYRRPYQYWLARVLAVTRATICKLIKALQKLGLVELQIDPEDRRLRIIGLTRLGRRCFARLFKTIRRGQVDAAIRNAWRTLDLNHNASCMKEGKLVRVVERYSRGIGEHTTLYDFTCRLRSSARPTVG